MRLGLDKTQLLSFGGGLAVVSVAGGLAWFGLGGLGQRQAEAQALTERISTPALAALLNDPAGVGRATRDAVEIQKLASELWEKDAVTSQWLTATRELAGEGKDWSKDPGKWKDRLITLQSQLQKEAKAGRLKLTPDFYLGLDAFRQKSPTAEEVPALALHLSVAERLVRRLMEARQIKEQYPTACEFLALAGPGSVQEKAPVSPTPATKPGVHAPEVERKTFRVEIRSSPEVFYEYVRLLMTDPALFIITDLWLSNEKQVFPLRSEIAKNFSITNSNAESKIPKDKKEKKRLLEILAGEESLNATLEIDFVAWKHPGDAKGGGALSPAANP